MVSRMHIILIGRHVTVLAFHSFGNKSFYRFGIRSCLASKSRWRFNWRHQCDVKEHFGVSRQQFHRLEPVWYRWQTPWLSSMKKCLQSVNHDQLQVLKKREEKCNNGETMEAIWASIFKKERKSRYKCVSLCRQVLSWMCQAMFLQSAFQFGFLSTVKTLSFFPQVFIRICLTLWKTQIF